MKKTITALINLTLAAGIVLLMTASPTCQVGSGWWSCIQHAPDSWAFELAVQQARERETRLEKLEHPTPAHWTEEDKGWPHFHIP